jgi:glycosyltransferase involved in cell wall biosynthesis
MNEVVFIHLCELAIALSAISGIILILMATWHDLRTIADKKTLDILTQRLPPSRQPSVVILVYTYNNRTTLLDCLESIRNNSYDNYQIIVIDNASSDQSSRLVSTYKRTYPTTPLLLYKRRKATNRLTALRAGYKKARIAELILVHNADSILPTATIKRSAARFITHERMSFIHLRPFVTFSYSISSLIATYLSLSKNVVKKAFPSSSTAIIDGSQGSVIMRAQLFLQAQARTHSLNTYNQTLTYRPLTTSLRVTSPHRRVLSALGIALGYLTVITMVTYFLITAAFLRSNSLLIISWLMVDIWFLTAIWSDEAINSRTKIELSLAVPFMYFVFYAYTCFQTAVRIIGLWRFIPSPRLALQSLRHTIQTELYSTRY